MFLIALFQSVALTGGTVHTMRADDAPSVRTVLIQDQRIVAVGADVVLPKDARAIDVSGLHLIPGLIDGMTNHDPDHDRLYVTSGITLIRDAGNDLARVLSERDREHSSGARNRSPGPDIWSAGPVLDGLPPSTTTAVVLTSVEEVNDKLKRLFELNLDYVSVQPGLTLPVWNRVLELAHKQGLQVWGPLNRQTKLADAIDAGQDGLFHLDALLPPAASWEKLRSEDFKDAIDKLKQSKTAITPLLGVFARRLIAPDLQAPELDVLGPFYLQAWRSEYELRRSVVDENYLRTGLKVLDLQCALLKSLYESGVTLVPGSASPNPWLMPGQAFIDELEMWSSRAKIPPAAVLRMATSGAARAIATDKERGTLEAGKIADIVVLRGDPEQDLTSLRRLEKVVLRGHVYDRAELDTMRKELADTQKQVVAAAKKPLEVSDPEQPVGDLLLRGSAESRAAGERISGESYLVVRRYDKSLVYAAHVLTPGSASVPATDLALTQTIGDGGFVTEFQVLIRSGTRTVRITGQPIGDKLSIERRINDVFIDNNLVKERLALVDAGSLTSDLIVAHHRAEGKFRVLYFEDLVPATAPWEMRLDKDGTHLIRAHDGARKSRFDPGTGGLIEAAREQGQGVVVTRSLSIRATGAGLPLPANKAALMKVESSTGTPADAATPKPADAPAKQKPKKDG